MRVQKLAGLCKVGHYRCCPIHQEIYAYFVPLKFEGRLLIRMRTRRPPALADVVQVDTVHYITRLEFHARRPTMQF